MTSITVDKDFGERNKYKPYAKREVRRICRKIAHHFGRFPKIFETRKGFHIMVNHLRITFGESMRWRLQLGDDKRRVLFDCKTKCKPKQIMFTEKDGHKVKEVSFDAFI